MNEKEQLLKEIEQAPDYLVKEVLNFLLFTKNKTQKNRREIKTRICLSEIFKRMVCSKNAIALTKCKQGDLLYPNKQ